MIDAICGGGFFDTIDALGSNCDRCDFEVFDRDGGRHCNIPAGMSCPG